MRARPTASPSVNDDEFTSALSGWTALGSLTTSNANSTIAGHLYMQAAAAGSYAVQGYYKAIPAMPFTVTCKLAGFDGLVGFDQQAFLMLGEATPGKLYTIGLAASSTGSSYRQSADLWNSATSFGSTPSAVVAWQTAPIYFRFVVTSSSAVQPYWSKDGLLWTPLGGSQNPAFTIGSVGLAINRSSNSKQLSAAFDWIRFA